MLRLEFIKGNGGAWGKTSYLAAMEKVKTSAKAAVENLCECNCFERLQMWSQCERSRCERNEPGECRRLQLCKLDCLPVPRNNRLLIPGLLGHCNRRSAKL